MTSIFSTRPRSPAALERHLLDLFAPTTSSLLADDDCRQASRASLWRLDAIHRAKNLSQLSLSLANLVTHPSKRWAAAETAAPARALARAYDQLALDCGSESTVPCLEMIAEVATKLTHIFGRARDIVVEMSGNEVLVVPESRRALVLICSELIINALKYAFPSGGPGIISVTLRQGPTGIDMVVQDDGVGLVPASPVGEGAGLLDRLAEVSGAVLHRDGGASGTGLRVTVHVAPLLDKATGTHAQ